MYVNNQLWFIVKKGSGLFIVVEFQDKLVSFHPQITFV